jgi:alpha-L-rhamnosidase
VFTFSKGKNATINLSYAEALYKIENTPDWKNEKQKGNRNDIDGKRFVGVSDQLISNGTEKQVFTSLSWRTYRYLQITVETKDEPLILEDVYGLATGYPFEMKAQFTSSDSSLSKILQTGWRTAKICALETYMDCPYFEQLQYVGDTRIQALVSLFNSGDDRLVRQAIDQLDHSRMAEGITLSRFPTAHAQQIPPFSLWWIAMIHDYWMYRNDAAYVQHKLPGIRQVLNFFSQYQTSDGSLQRVPYWNFSDWANGVGWKNGVAPVGSDGSTSALDLQLCLAYQSAAALEKSMGNTEFAKQYDDNAKQLQQTIRSKYWDNNRKLFADTSEKNSFSQHSNALAVLTGIVDKDDARQLVENLLADKSITPATIYFQYYVHQALRKAGLGDRYLSLLGDWHLQLANGLTTWAEISDYNRARSDAHAWGASPNVELLRTVLGIDSGSPGFEKIIIEPHLSTLTRASGKMPHPRGEVMVDYHLNKGKWKAVINIPEHTQGIFRWKGKEFILEGGKKNEFDL